MFSLLQTYFLFPFILITFISFKWISFRLKIKKKLPPSPPKLPIIGNLHQLGSSPHRSLRALSQKHGSLMLMQFGSVPTLVASSAESAKEIMKTHDLKFANRPKLIIPDMLIYGSSDITFSPYGEFWRQVKSIAVVHLLNTSRVHSFRHVREKEIGLMIESIEKSNGSIIDLNLLAQFVHVLGALCIGNYIPWLSWIDRLSGLEDKARKVAKEFDEFLEGVVREHLDKRSKGDAHTDQDLVDVLLDIQRDNAIGFDLQRDTIKAIILDVFAAGTDTTYGSLVWSISELIRHPRVMKKLQQEVTEVAQGRTMIYETDLEKMEYLKATIKETLRLYPPIPLLIPRESMQDVNVMGYDIPAGTQTIVNAWAIGRDPSLWEEPDEFRPERFLNSSIDYKGLHFELLPFGAGRRGCPGVQFAIVMYELALANVIYKFDLSLPDGVKDKDLDMSETNSITLHKRSPLLVKATPRF
ncbi:putative cytochrome P450 [Helianthus annuus]|nr:putative cytochrome P450 [Helianthus annuus]